MLEQQRFRGDGTCTTRAEQFREGDEQVNRQEEQYAHESNATMTATMCKTARQRLRALNFANSPPTGKIEGVDVLEEHLARHELRLMRRTILAV